MRDKSEILQEFTEAQKECDRLSKVLQKFTNTQPLDAGKDITPFSMADSLAAHTAYDACVKKRDELRKELFES